MTSADRDPHPAPSSAPQVAQPRRTAHVSFWIKELPFTLVLILTIGRVAYTSFSKKPIIGYWEIRADHCASLRRRRVAGGGRQERAIAPDCNPGAALVRLPASDEFDAAHQRAEDFHCADDGAGDFHPAGARHIYRGRACALVAGGSSRPDHGAGHSSNCLDQNSALLVVLIAAAAVGVGAVLWWHWHQGRSRRLRHAQSEGGQSVV